MLKQDSIFCIGNSSSIITLSNTVFKRLKGDCFRVSFKEDIELLYGNTEIRLIELISVDPSHGTIQSSFLNNGMEQQNTVQKPFEFLLRVSIEEFREANRCD